MAKIYHEGILELTKNISVKSIVLRAMGELGGAKEAGYLREVLTSTKEYELAMAAAKALKRMGRHDVLTSYRENELSENGENIVKHVLDDRI